MTLREALAALLTDYWGPAYGKAADRIIERPEWQAVRKAVLAEALAVERLADLEHRQWSSWAASLLGDPTVVLGDERRARWNRLRTTAYDDLTEDEKDQDRVWAAAILAALTAEAEG